MFQSSAKVLKVNVMKKVVVVGNGMVGFKFCEKLRAKAGKDRFQLVVYGEETLPAYDRVHLSEYFETKDADKLSMAPRNWYQENDIKLLTGQLVTEVDTINKEITSHTGEKESYDYLVLATGSSPFVPPVKGVDKKGVFVYRTIEDLDGILEFAKRSKSAAILGGGLLGLEGAKAIVDMGLKTHVVEFAPKLMPRQLDEEGSQMLQSKLEDLGISIHLSKNTSEIKGDDTMCGMTFADGTELDVDMLVISAGIRPRDEVARISGIAVGERGGILVDDYMKTSALDIFSIGESALHRGMIYGLVAPGYEMADIVVTQLVEEDTSPFTACDMSTKLKLAGIDVASFGDPFGEKEKVKSIVFEDKVGGIYKRVNISEDGQRILGGILVGDAAEYNMLHQMTINKMKLPENPEDLILGARGGEGGGIGVEDLPDEAVVCSCENVSKGSICGVVKDQGIENTDDIKTCTKAGTGCGGCMPMITDLLNVTMKEMGKVVKNVLCEHFDHSRQELYDIVRITGIRSYDEVLDKHGNGDGCEKCKPAVASILASVHNDMVLDADNDTNQDTNDRFLANIQRGGTYSVIPRVPAGEITPEKLIVLGEVAKKYDLYCKITGGQRIDLLGASVDDLPAIWEELIAAGFESGHAYGKSLRTVKSCVGSTWCRYGVQDAVTFAIEVENRYKGLRSPHKLKSAVSGCVRECAEAQSKDFGIIATDKGWNLFVCGNGGAKPQHAVLLASDIDSETLIKYVDRFLMFYIKTAEPLMRTSTWFAKLEGGLNYLKDVVINDSLGLCDQFEKEMQHVVSTYQCEWKTTVESPKLRAKFSHFLNDDSKDASVEFVDMRGQKVPAAW